ncbi:GyrI-like domain-containing protein [Paenibacillus alkalitolerans]|uniref:GyrI-like domain-containing protein n=1 Tax=Paenibacillus alkalitolerans TaxID=2799335 RepID=UPI0018F30CE5|nr:effector binding domain-containing protein [Paenibacillus alkalitolerans]
MSTIATFECEVVTKEYQFVGQSITANFPNSFPEAAIKVQTDFFQNRRFEVSNALNSDILFSPYMCNRVVATYFACLEVEDYTCDTLPGMISFTLPETAYVKIACTNNTIFEGYEKLSKWLEENNYKHRLYGACQIEIYHHFHEGGEQPAEVLIPIER